MRALKRVLDRVGDRVAAWVLGSLESDESTAADDLYFALIRSGLRVDVTWRDEPDAGRVRRISYTNSRGDRIVAHDFTSNGRYLLTVWDTPTTNLAPEVK